MNNIKPIKDFPGYQWKIKLTNKATEPKGKK